MSSEKLVSGITVEYKGQYGTKKGVLQYFSETTQVWFVKPISFYGKAKMESISPSDIVKVAACDV